MFKTTDLDLITRLGFRRAESSAREPWMKAIPPEDIARSAEAMSVLTQGGEWQGRVRMRTVTDDTLILHVRARPTRRDDGSITVSVLARDITDVARLESALAEAQGRLHLLDSIMALGMWTTDEDLRFTRSSGSILGEDNSLVGASLYEYFGSADIDIPPIAGHLDALAGHSSTLDVEWEGRDIRVLLEPFRDELDEIAGVSGVGLDPNILLRVARERGGTQVTRVQHDRVHPAPISESAATVSINGLLIDADRFEVRKSRWRRNELKDRASTPGGRRDRQEPSVQSGRFAIARTLSCEQSGEVTRSGGYAST